jgi:chain length determinant protein EpsF
MSFTQIAVVLSARKRLVFGIALALIVVVGTASAVLPKRYVAAVTLVVDTKAADPVTGALLPLQMLPGYFATQLDIITSHTVALKVVDQLDLTALPALREQFQAEAQGAGSLRHWLADRLLEQLDVRPSRDSSVIAISYASTDPSIAAQMANAFAEAYAQASLELKVDPARRQAGWFGEQVAELRAGFEEAQLRLSEYQNEQTVVAITVDRIDLEGARLAELSSQLVGAQSALYAAETRQEQMQRAFNSNRLDALPDILGNPLLQSLKAELVRTEVRLADVSSRFGANHPQYLSVVAELDSLNEELAAELATAQGAIDQAAEIANQQVNTLQQAVEQQKANVLELNGQRDTMSVLTREVENARSAYDAAMQRRTHVQLESEVNQTDIAILDPAIAPLTPAFPLLGLNLLLASVLGMLLGACVALLAESTDRRLRLASDLEELSGIPVLAVLHRGNRRERRRQKRAIRAASAA